MWKVINKEVDWENRHHSLTMMIWVALKENVQTSKDICENYRTMFESRISAGAKEKLLCSGKPDADISSWSHDMEGHAKKCVERYCELTNKTTSNCTKLQLHVMKTIKSRVKNWDLLENCQTYALKMFSNACIWHVLVDLIFYGPLTNLLVLSLT